MKVLKDIKLFNPEINKTYSGRIIINNGVFEGFVKENITQEESVVFGTMIDGEFLEIILSESDENILPTAYKVVLSNEKQIKSSVKGHSYPIASYEGILLSKTAYYEYEIGNCNIKTLDPFFYCFTEQEDFEYVEKRISVNEIKMNTDTKELYRTIISKEKNKQMKKINKHNI